MKMRSSRPSGIPRVANELSLFQSDLVFGQLHVDIKPLLFVLLGTNDIGEGIIKAIHMQLNRSVDIGVVDAYRVANANDLLSIPREVSSLRIDTWQSRPLLCTDII